MVFRVDEKNGVIFQVMFNPAIIVIKMSQMTHILYFLLMTAKKHTVCTKYLHASFSSLRKCYVLLGSEIPLTRCEPLKM